MIFTIHALNRLNMKRCEYTFQIKTDTHRIISCVSNHAKIIGDFCIYSERLFVHGYTHSLTIGIDDEYQKLGLSNYLMYYMLRYIKQQYPSAHLDMLFYIDTDASHGFWNHIGMTPNRYGYYTGNREIEGKGYEKNISLRKLHSFVSNLVMV